MMDWGEIAGVIQTVWKVLCPFVEIGILAFLIYEVRYFQAQQVLIYLYRYLIYPPDLYLHA